MGCFLGCFGSSKGEKRRKNAPHDSAPNPVRQSVNSHF